MQFNFKLVLYFSPSDVGSVGQQRQVDEAYGTMGSNNGNSTLRSNISTGSGSSSSVVTVIAAPNTDDGNIVFVLSTYLFCKKEFGVSHDQYLLGYKYKLYQLNLFSASCRSRFKCK